MFWCSLMDLFKTLCITLYRINRTPAVCQLRNKQNDWMKHNNNRFFLRLHKLYYKKCDDHLSEFQSIVDSRVQQWKPELATIRNHNMKAHLDTTFGAIQYGVPTIVWRLSRSGVSCAQNPKSVTFTSPFIPSSTLSDLMSLWMISCRWRNANASRHLRQIPAIRPSLNTVSVTTSVSAPPCDIQSDYQIQARCYTVTIHSFV